MNNFAERLKSLRLSKNLSQKQLAEKIGYGSTIILYWEKGKKEPNLKALEALSSFFNVSVDFLIGRVDEYGNQVNDFTPSGDPTRILRIPAAARSKGNKLRNITLELTEEQFQKLIDEIDRKD